LKNHWKKWLPAFPSADLKKVNEGLQDDVPIVINAAIQCIPKNKHSVDPDVLYKVQLKSSVPEIGVPCPKHMTENSVSFPCMVKVDMSRSGLGNRVAKNKDEFSAILKELREGGWKDNVVFQEMIQGIKEVVSFQFNLNKSGEIYWIGSIVGGFNGFSWTNGVVDWDKQEEYKNLFYDEFVIPVKNYLHERGYFGIVMCDVLICDHGKYLVDLNPRVSGDTTHLLLAPYMAQFGLKHSILKQGSTINKPAKTLVELADHININTNIGKVIVVSAADVDDERSQYEVSVFAQTSLEVTELHNKLSYC
jgi:predicted ATP-grasp superfamily ATP-dependent carboligase